MFEPEKLGNLPPDEAVAAFVEPARTTGNDVEPALAQGIVAVSGGDPYFIQFFGAHLWRLAGGAGKALTQRLWRAHQREIRDRLDEQFFQARFSRATRAERAFLQLIAQGGEEATIEQIIAPGPLDNSRIQPKIAALTGKGLLYRPSRGRIAFTTPLFGDFLRRHTED